MGSKMNVTINIKNGIKVLHGTKNGMRKMDDIYPQFSINTAILLSLKRERDFTNVSDPFSCTI
jgi:hypothetical protein